MTDESIATAAPVAAFVLVVVAAALADHWDLLSGPLVSIGVLFFIAGVLLGITEDGWQRK